MKNESKNDESKKNESKNEEEESAIQLKGTLFITHKKLTFSFYKIRHITFLLQIIIIPST